MREPVLLCGSADTLHGHFFGPYLEHTSITTQRETRRRETTTQNPTRFVIEGILSELSVFDEEGLEVVLASAVKRVQHTQLDYCNDSPNLS